MLENENKNLTSSSDSNDIIIKAASVPACVSTSRISL